MQSFVSLALRYDKDKKLLEVLDQRRIPHEEVWLVCSHPQEMIEFIKRLSVRGAPLIGAAAAASLGSFFESGVSLEDFKKWAELMREARPTAVNLMWAVDQLLKASHEGVECVAKVVDEIITQDKEMCDRMAKFGAALVKPQENILTHCNTGGLATVGCGTALGVIAEAWNQGKNIHVYVDETRPLLQGGRLTAWELKKLGIPYTLICDNMAACLMRDGKIDRVFLGADRIAVNHDVANKIGTYSVAVLCKFHGVPFHVVAPQSTFDPDCPSGAEIQIEQRKADEVRGVSGAFGNVRWAPEDAETFNPSFDVTPATLIQSIVCDTGVIEICK